MNSNQHFCICQIYLHDDNKSRSPMLIYNDDESHEYNILLTCPSSLPDEGCHGESEGWPEGEARGSPWGFPMASQDWQRRYHQLSYMKTLITIFTVGPPQYHYCILVFLVSLLLWHSFWDPRHPSGWGLPVLECIDSTSGGGHVITQMW